MSKPRFQPKKFRELVLYLIEKHTTCMHPCHYRRLSLLLFLAEHEHYLRFGKTITGAEFIKASWGPDCKQLRAALERLTSDGSITWVPIRPYFSMV